MFKRRKSILCLLIAVLMMASASTAAMAASPYETRYNNTVMASSVASISESGLLTVDNQFQGIRGKTTKGEITTYPHYSADCANFVSQCVYWGGLSMNGSSVNVGIHDSTTNWYCIYINTILWVRRYAVTTSWIRVSDFNAYFSSIGTKTTKTTISALVSSCAVGDPVQLADKTTGTAYHTIIISEKDSSTAYFCGHTNSRNNVNVYDYLNQNQDKFILFDIT